MPGLITIGPGILILKQKQMNERLKNSIEVLQKAYLEGTLKAGDCQACAVGNLVQASSYEGNSRDWRYIFCTAQGKQHFYLDREPIFGEDEYEGGLKAIKATSYSVKELAKVEYAFETAISIADHCILPKHVSQWKRLKAVIKVLFEIEGIPYNQEVEEPFLEKALS